jgi:hypothetical protein
MVELGMTRFVRVPALHDAVRIATPDREETIRRLVLHLTARSPPWTYNPVRGVAPPLLARTLPLSAAIHACERHGPVVAKAMNVEVAKLVWEAGAGRSLRCYPLSRRYFSIRHDLELRIPADFYIVEDGVPVVFWLQPRKGYALDDFGRRLLASVVYQELSAEWDYFGFEMLDTSPLEPGEPRYPRTFRLPDLPLLPETEVTAVMQQFADAFDAVREMDLGLDRKIGDRPDASDGPGPLFDDH